MAAQDPIADLLTCIRNAQKVGRRWVDVPNSRFGRALVALLVEEGFLGGWRAAEGSRPRLRVDLKYFRGAPVIESIDRVSRPGLRIYRGWKRLPVVMGGLGIAVISTSRGLMSDHQARRLNLGGEVICQVT